MVYVQVGWFAAPRHTQEVLHPTETRIEAIHKHRLFKTGLLAPCITTTTQTKDVNQHKGNTSATHPKQRVVPDDRRALGVIMHPNCLKLGTHQPGGLCGTSQVIV